MKKFLFATCLLLLVIGLSGCGTSRPSVLKKDFVAEQEMDFSLVSNVGNRTYIPLNINGKPSDHAETILTVLDSFDKRTPELKITNWKIEKKDRSDYIYGLWVDEEPR